MLLQCHFTIILLDLCFSNFSYDNCDLVTRSCLTLSTPQIVVNSGPSVLSPRDFPGKSTEVGYHFLLRGSSQPRDQTLASSIVGKFFTNWATREAPSNSGGKYVILFIHCGFIFDVKECYYFCFCGSFLLVCFLHSAKLVELWMFSNIYWYSHLNFLHTQLHFLQITIMLSLCFQT